MWVMGDEVGEEVMAVSLQKAAALLPEGFLSVAHAVMVMGCRATWALCGVDSVLGCGVEGGGRPRRVLIAGGDFVTLGGEGDGME